MTLRNFAKLTSVLALTASLGACATADRLSQIGKPPALSPVEDPTAVKGYKPVQMPMPAMEHASFAPNSLWRTGSRAFFKDQRARLVGDLVTVKVKVTDRAQLDNTTKRSRKNGEDFGWASRTSSARCCRRGPIRPRC
jgi:flagellar L-ring protein precursor FlgH